MADSYKAVTRIKFADDDGNAEYIERGESVSKSDAQSDEEWEGWLADQVVMESEQFDVQFPDPEAGYNQAPGTPSNLAKVEGTTLQAEGAEDPGEHGNAETPPANPADPPVVDNAGTAKGFDTKGTK